MQFSSQKNLQKKKLYLLLFILFFNVASIAISAFYDRGIHWNHRDIVKLSELRYWLWFFTWWSAWTSLLTICWVIYKLFFTKKKSSYKEQFFDLMIAEINFISGVFFCLGGFLLTWKGWGRPPIPFPWLGMVNPAYLWIVHNIFWHVLAPGLCFYYFWKYCQVDKLASKKRLTGMINLINPTAYFFYALIRPEIKMINYTNKLRGNQAYQYPADYPYFFLYWGRGKFSGPVEEKNQNNGWFFWHYWPPWLQKIFWLSIITIITYLTFWLLFYYLIKFKNSKNKRLWKNHLN